MAADKEDIGLSRVHMDKSKCFHLETIGKEKTTRETSQMMHRYLDRYCLDTIWQRTAQDRLTGGGMLRPSPNHGTLRLPNDDDDDDDASFGHFLSGVCSRNDPAFISIVASAGNIDSYIAGCGKTNRRDVIPTAMAHTEKNSNR